jgi:hypothetical protein
LLKIALNGRLLSGIKKHGTKVASYDLEFNRRKFTEEDPIIEAKTWAFIDSLCEENKRAPNQKYLSMITIGAGIFYGSI